MRVGIGIDHASTAVAGKRGSHIVFFFCFSIACRVASSYYTALKALASSQSSNQHNLAVTERISLILCQSFSLQPKQHRPAL